LWLSSHVSWQQRERARSPFRAGYVTKLHGARLRVALTFPNTHWVACRTWLQTVYRLLNAQDDVVRAGVSAAEAELAELVASRAPLLTLESYVAVGEFDVFAFSVSFEWDTSTSSPCFVWPAYRFMLPNAPSATR
jgi:hypothetical protein